jgi:penicillin-binding protein 1A
MLMVIIGWLAITAPLSKSLQPIAPPQLTLVSADGRPIARNGAVVDRPVDVTTLPPHVIHAFLATEDRRFYDHWGVDPRGIARAFWTNLTTGRRQGGSTITQQLAKFTFLTADQTYTRKAREMLIAWWMEAWLSKDEILSRYLSNAYFGDNVYGLRAASLHYFYGQPERLTLSQAAMLAGLVKAPSRLAPTRNLRAAQEREKVVLAAMVDAGYLTEAERRAVRLARTDTRARSSLPTGTYFADWAMPQARATVQSGYGEARVTTTLDARLQDIARRVTARGAVGRAQVALVAMVQRQCCRRFRRAG